jgi:hypothetical protein
LSDLATLALIVQVGIAVWAMWKRRAWSWAPLVLVMVVLAATGRRNIPVASLVMVPVAAPAFAGLGSLRVGSPPSRRAVAAACVAIAVAVGAVVAAMPHDEDLGPYPVAAVTWMREHRLVARQGVRLVHPDYVGNYLEWRFGSSARVFVDDRAEILSPQLIGDYVHGLLDTDRDWSTVLDRYDANVVLWPSADVLGRELRRSGAWTVAHTAVDGTGRSWLVACRVDSDVASRC